MCVLGGGVVTPNTNKPKSSVSPHRETVRSNLFLLTQKCLDFLPDEIGFFPQAVLLNLFFSLLGLRGVGAAKPAPQTLSVARSPPPAALPAANSDRNNDSFCVFHCGRWSLSLSASSCPSTAGRMSQTVHYAAFSCSHYSPTAAIVSRASPPCFPPPELSVLTLLDYIQWHKSNHRNVEI